MDIIILVQILIWAIGGWITGLLLKSAGMKLTGGHLFLMLIGWGLAGIVGIIGWAYFTQGNFYFDPGGTLMYGLICGLVGGLVSVRQVAKARRKKLA